ncbi:hypothetical protein CA223_15405 [Sphingomonas koreensis]|uniref:Uncharacterized protein n=2 Tax=Sphingomonadaceae TaxID=41297 RepID=A0AAJ4VB24_9SPHN|nr:hypothetical protein F4U96_11795 [Sphingobium limneticum]MAF62158.1 hypothetical protein [Blastomonas sp.]MBF5091387.1 hypothetical protein [Novosphingobium sp. NBM11]OYX47232.1 MAG: hypothetical protein B7Y87_01750 [Sphingomonadales bacterium 32-64-22]QBE90637.1 hypothetical protein DRN02_000100 [Sphingomonas paucimobilis]QEH77869.1 hypothetical protein EIK56_06720 [Sphingomonas sp. C8-2]RSU22895.1 hypothetical protein CA224_05855 [Sphingomonas koreensis]
MKPSIALFEGDRRFAVVVRLPDAQRDDLETLGVIPVMLPAAEGQAGAAGDYGLDSPPEDRSHAKGQVGDLVGKRNAGARMGIGIVIQQISSRSDCTVPSECWSRIRSQNLRNRFELHDRHRSPLSLRWRSKGGL